MRPDNKSLLHVGKNCYENLFREVFSDSNIILFIPNINSVRVFINGKEERACFRQNEKWIVGDYENEIKEELKQLINKTIEKGNSRIPEKYKDFDCTKVSFACNHKGAMIKPVDDAPLYCYLPTRAAWGFPFLMNTDMIPKGDRNDIETEVKLLDEDETNFNEELAFIAGSKLFLWIRDLLTSRKYQLGSVFSLVPDFKKCKREHKDYTSFIEKFEEAFNACLETETIIPVPHGIALVNRVILDTTGLSSSGIITDDEFRKFVDMEDYSLPLPMLRNDKHFDSFLKRYAEEDQIFEIEDLSSLIDNDEFQKWLKDQVNNNNFINFLLEKELLDDFSEQPIFINETDGELCCARDLYYDVDEYIDDLSFFSDEYLHRVSNETKAFFEGNEVFADFVSRYFEVFDSSDFVSELYNSTNRESTIQTLSNVDNSIRFVHFLASEKIDDDYVSVPLYNARQELIDTVAILFFDRDNKRGYEIKQMSWLPSNAYDFVSNDYMLRDKDIVETFFDNYGVRTFSEDIVINEIVLEDDSVGSINDNIKTISDSVEFISFLEKNENMISEDVFNSSFKVYVNNGGVSSFDTVDNNTFFSSQLFDSFDSLSWNDNWLFELDELYFDGLNEAQKTIRKSFFAKTFGVRNITKEIFYDEFISDKLKELNLLIQKDRTKNIDFWRWAQNNLSTKAEELRSLHLIVTNSEEVESYAAPDSTYIYMSDVYMPGCSCIEGFVKEYIPDSLFVSSDYVDDKSSSSIVKWNSFLKSLDVSADVTRILIDNILPDLSSIENDNLPSLLMANWSQLKENGKAWGDLKELKLRCKDESFYSLEDCCLVNTDKEPFVCVPLDNEYNLKTNGQVGWFISQIAENNDIEIISTASDWRVEKINKYLQLQNDSELENDIHFAFINELVSLEGDEIAKLKDQIEEIQLLSKDNEYCNVEDLTLGHIYNPICDFEANGVDSLTYLSEDYHRRQTNEKNLREVFKIHRFFDKDDIELLEDNPAFAKYIWYTYIKDSKQYDKIKGYAEKGDFDDVPCVLSQIGEVCSPNCLYSAEISEYVKGRTEDWQSKTIDSYLVSSYPELISCLDLRQSLDFNDSLIALLYIQSKEKRKQLFGWLCDGDYDEDAVSRFLEDPRATWKNNKGNDVLIKNLYAISPDNERLLSYFRKHERILDVSYVNKSDFEGICKILGITIIDDSDVEIMPRDKRKVNLHSIFNRSLFVISCLETEEWRERYENYKQELLDVEFFSCKSINIGYIVDDDSISVSAQRFYSCDKQIYYVGLWSDRKVYTDVVSAIHENLDLSIDIEKAKQLFDPDESFVDVISEECRTLFSDEDFLMELRNMLPRVYGLLFQHEETDPKPNNSNDKNQETVLSKELGDLQGDEYVEEEREGECEDDETAKDDNDEWERSVCDYMGGGFQLPEEEVLAENMITRWRVLNYLKEHDTPYKISASFDEERQKKYIQGNLIVITLDDNKKLLAQGAKGGIWHISPNVWRGFEKESLVVCLCVGNGEEDFKFAESLDDIEQCADTPNVLVKVSPKDEYSMMESINTVFPGRDNYKMNIHLMVKVHSTKNNKLDNIFDKAFDAPQDDYEF
ncbi:MAG: hypothetical protein MJZ15_04610 [Bacteroidales bacterium]|nr:hypothetical protein [Bacteroidales bacterium]